MSVNTISLEELWSTAQDVRKELRAKGEFPDHKRSRPRSIEKEEALFIARTNAACKYGVKRAPDGTYSIQGLLDDPHFYSKSRSEPTGPMPEE